MTAAFALLGAAAGTAHADSSGCTSVSNWSIKGVALDNVCIEIHGSGNHVDRMYAVFIGPGGIDNPRLRLTAFDLDGKQKAQWVSQQWLGHRTNETFEVKNVDLPTGKVCAEVGTSGSWSPGACKGIFP